MSALKPCSIVDCKRQSAALCHHCSNDVCYQHLTDHVEQINNELYPLSDQLNALQIDYQKLDLTSIQAKQCHPLDRWRQQCYAAIDAVYDEKQKEIDEIVKNRYEEYAQALLNMTKEIQQLVNDQRSATQVQLSILKQSVNNGQILLNDFNRECFQIHDSHPLQVNPIEMFDQFIPTFITRNQLLFIGDGTLLSDEHQIELNEFCARPDQKWGMIYKATRDGFGATDFHRLCDKKGPTIILIQVENNYLFGGYTKALWNANSGSAEDPTAFIFTLHNPFGIPPTKFPIRQQFPVTSYALCSQIKFGPQFGQNGQDIKIVNESNRQDAQNTIGFPRHYTDTTGRGSRLFIGTANNFSTTEIEVYRLI